MISRAMLTRADIEAAAARNAGRVRATPVAELEPYAFGSPAQIALKLELLQHTGSFKPRGAFSHILSQPVPKAGVIAASGGNHGAAVAYAAQTLGYRAEIYVPAATPRIKLDRLEHYGAHVVATGARYAEALAASSARAEETGALVVHAYDQEEVLAGQGTLGRELQMQAPGLETVFVAVGGGGLVGGVAAWYRGSAKVIAVEPAACPTLAHALEAGRPVDVEVGGLAADSLGARRVGALMFPIAQQFVERVVLVSDDQILAAQRLLWEHLRVLAEPGGATALAGFLWGEYRPRAGERIGVIVCGANTDPALFASTKLP
jgi:threonine dehydratase